MRTKIITNYLIVALISFLILSIVIVLSSNGSKPGDIFYSLDRGFEPVQTTFASFFGERTLASTYLSFADERVDEIKALTTNSSPLALIPVVHAAERETKISISSEKKEVLNTLTQEYSENMDMAHAKMQKAHEKGLDTGELIIKFTEKALKHQEVLLAVYDRVPEQAKDSIMKAIEKSQNGHEQAMNAVSGDKKRELQIKHEKKKQELEYKISERKNKILERKEEKQGNNFDRYDLDE